MALSFTNAHIFGSSRCLTAQAEPIDLHAERCVLFHSTRREAFFLESLKMICRLNCTYSIYCYKCRQTWDCFQNPSSLSGQWCVPFKVSWESPPVLWFKDSPMCSAGCYLPGLPVLRNSDTFEQQPCA